MKHTPFIQYPHSELVAAWQEWVRLRHLVVDIASPETLMPLLYAPRLKAWEHYCDLRDGLPHGTTHLRRTFGDKTVLMPNLLDDQPELEFPT